MLPKWTQGQEFSWTPTVGEYLLSYCICQEFGMDTLQGCDCSMVMCAAVRRGGRDIINDRRWTATSV